jgi:hemolysin III
MKPQRPLLRGHSHQAMFFLSLSACILLIIKSKTPIEYFSSTVYAMAVLTMFGISALFHRVTWQPKAYGLMKQLDHSAIFIMIAGNFTPVCLLALPQPSGTRLLIAVWIVAVVGIAKKIVFKNAPRWLSVFLYLSAGYMAVPYIPELYHSLGDRNVALLISGGVVYTIGALCYALKWPDPDPKVFGFHEIFHLLVNLGAVLHFIVIWSLI